MSGWRDSDAGDRAGAAADVAEQQADRLEQPEHRRQQVVRIGGLGFPVQSADEYLAELDREARP